MARPAGLSTSELHEGVDDEGEVGCLARRVAEGSRRIEAGADLAGRSEGVAVALSSRSAAGAHSLSGVEDHAAHGPPHLLSEVSVPDLDLLDDGPQLPRNGEHHGIDSQHGVISFRFALCAEGATLEKRAQAQAQAQRELSSGVPTARSSDRKQDLPLGDLVYPRGSTRWETSTRGAVVPEALRGFSSRAPLDAVPRGCSPASVWMICERASSITSRGRHLGAPPHQPKESFTWESSVA